MGDESGSPARFTEAERRFDRRRRSIGLPLGPALFVLMLIISPAGLSSTQLRLAAVLAWTLTWWITEAVPIPVTALLGPMLAVVCGVGTAGEMLSPFGSPIIFLFLGSFIIAAAMFHAGLDRRLAFAILSSRLVGTSTTRMLLAFGVSIAVLSMWLSNTATTAMMYPIALSVLAALAKLLEQQQGKQVDPTRLRYGTSLMLVTAYASSIGGAATPVGSPPNLVALGQLQSLANIRISFFGWMGLALPATLVMLVLALVYLRLALPPEMRSVSGSRAAILQQREALGPLRPQERNVLIAFGITVGLWVLPGVLALVVGTRATMYQLVQGHLPEAVVALLGAALLFVLPVDWRARQFTITWEQASRIDWGTLLLFGGGLSLGGAMFRTGLAEQVGNGLVHWTGANTLASLTILFTVVGVFGTEATSNTAAATMLCPLAIAAARTAGVDPLPPTVATAIGCGMAFMLPVATPPNAIVYGSGCVPITKMVRHGLVLNLAAIVTIPATLLAVVWLRNR